MRYFVCLFDTTGQGIPESVRRRYESLPRARGLDFAWQSFSQAAVHSAALAVWDEVWGDPLVVSDGRYLAVGTVRLDNRTELERWAECGSKSCTDLELLGHLVARHGTKYIPLVLGDFAIVVWDGTTRTIVAATDAFAVKRLYYSNCSGLLAFASRAEALALDERYEVQYLAELVAGCTLLPDLTVYAGVKQLPAGTLAVGERGQLTTQTYWSPEEFAPDPALVSAEREAADMCRELLATSVQRRLGPAGTTWAQLSGGLDSSSVVSMAQSLAERGTIQHGLAGTVTYVDRAGTESDERRYSELVAARWGIRNETVVDPPLWLDGDEVPPRTDQPRHALSYFPRERRMLMLIRAAGGRILLTGFAGDELFTGTMLFFADWIARGRVWSAFREMAHRAAIGRTSFWELMYGNALLPLLPRALRDRLFADQHHICPWVAPAAVQRYCLRERGVIAEAYAGPFGEKYHHAIVNYVTEIGRALDPGFLGQNLDMRYPYLYRPLVEFALRLPPELCVRPQARKWVLREAMRGFLPDVVRNRIGKGGPTERVAWSLTAQRSTPRAPGPATDSGRARGDRCNKAPRHLRRSAETRPAWRLPAQQSAVHTSCRGMAASAIWPMAAEELPQECSSSIVVPVGRSTQLTGNPPSLRGLRKERYMKKTYSRPIVIDNGGVVRETMGSGPDPVEGGGFEKSLDIASGFYL